MWWAYGINSVGDGAFTAAVPLLAVSITSDPRLISLISAASFLPWLLVSLPAGAIVDRHDRVGLMWRSQAIEAVIVAVVAVLAAVGAISIPVLAGMAFLLGICEVCYGNAAQAVLPEIVPAPLLHKANGNQYTVNTIGESFLGPPVGSLLFTLAIALPFGLDAVSFALSAVLLATLPRRRARRGNLASAPRPSTSTAVVDGLRWLRGHRLLRTIALVLGVNTFAFQLANATLVLFATRTLHVSTRGYGVLLAAGAIGSVIGGLVNARIVARIGSLPALLTALIVNVLVFVAIGLSPNAFVLGGLMAITGFITTLWNIVTVSLRQRVVPAELLGRVNSVYRMLGWGLIPLGAVCGGFVAHGLGLRACYPIAGAIRAVALVAALPILVGALRAERAERAATTVTAG
jgi:MFS family permease